ncbi:sigma-54 dependent transcriptional regulator [Geomonas sp. Red69]|uniref:sigma-54-dependent transcriptional regulator n=1 Tax=Geomonas diazotrophica TaxID=2843197 RepID=UPI001C110E49|nr:MULTISPECIES: sigma-54 dependent transcriptional regulator [Geomonas]MBU5636034.1 sigma-54 dependent transcriptional regulator [Geomonas diazotrophica]QXE85890.1 sigma-54 dependent transcriptional regulator [Geomonas nitrogeniifigens]
MPPKILIIDDDSSLRRVLEYNLQQEGYDVYTAADGSTGLQLFEEKSPQLVITDLKMPGITGFEVLSTVKERAPSTVVIVLTAFGAIDTAVEAMKLGAFHYLTKPFNREELKVTVLKGLQLQGLSEENRLLKEELSGRTEFKSIVGTSRAMEGVFSVVRKVADTEATVLITGESGTGKELVARAIHSGSSRRAAPFVAVNCAAIPRDLLESELFGHVKGAFTGAIRDKEGKFQLADGGTIFLDEVGDLPLELQPKLLRVLQERVVEPVGGTSLQKIDLRVVAATNADLERWIAEGKFREDLYYRLSVIPVQLPPLRERVEDVPLLIRYFCGKFGAEAVTFSKEALQRLQEYAWPGNVRELENTVERLLIMREGDQIGVDELPAKIAAAAPAPEGGVLRLPAGGYSLEQLEMEVVLEALNRCDWNQTAAARFLRIPRHTLIYRMEKYNISQPGRK